MTLVQQAERLIDREDPAVSALVAEALREDGIATHARAGTDS